MTQMFQSKRAIAPVVGAALISIVPFLLIALLGGTATLKFLMTDKTPYIIGGIFLFLILFKQKRKQGEI